MKSLNIVIINRLMGIRFGGGENFDLHLAQQLIKLGHHVKIITGKPFFKKENKFCTDADVLFVRTPYLRWLHYKFMNSRFKLLRFIGMLGITSDRWIFRMRLQSLLPLEESIDIYQITGFPHIGAYLKKFCQLSVIRWPGPPSKSLFPVMAQCSANFANGDAYKRIHSTGFKTIRFINVGVDTERFYCKRTQKPDSELIHFLFVGRIVPIKNIPFLLAGFNEAYLVNKTIRLTIVGSGDEAEVTKVKGIIQNLSLDSAITLLPAQMGKDLINIYQQADCFILTSEYDNYPNVILEAMASGLPVIGTDVGGISDQITHSKGGFLIEPHNIAELRKAILTLSKNPKLRFNMGQYNQKWVQKTHSWGSTANNIESLYYSLLNPC